MKTLYKNLIFTAAGAVLCLFLAVPANAQRTTSGGGGGGGSHPSGGGGGGSSASSARPSAPSGGGGGARPAVSGGGARPAGYSGGGAARPSVGVVQRGAQKPTYVYQNGSIVRNNPGVRQGVAGRGNSGPQRVGVAATGAYRTAPRIGGYNHADYWGTHGYYHFNHGYYNSYYGVRLGYQCRVLPYGYYPFFWGDSQYYFSDGLFYSYDNEQYTVVEPPIGAEIASLPTNAQSIVINGQQYYEDNGVYYQQVTKDDGSSVYVVAGKDGELNTGTQQVQDDQPRAAQLGDIVTQLPQDCRKIKLNGEKLYISPDGIYFKEIVDAQGNKTYKIVGLPSDETDAN